MADRTHSHDTSTPAVSDETVPSEEFVLVPKEFLDFLRHAPVGSGTCCCGDDMQKHSNSEHSPVDMWDHELDQWLKQIATLPASHLAKEGGEAGAAAPPAKLAHRIVLHCQNTPPEEAIEIAERLIVTALNHPMNVPQPSPALAKGGYAEALRTNIEAFLDMHRKGVLVPPTPALPIELLEKALTSLTTPSPQPAHSDDLAVDRFAVAMKAKLADARAKGKGGWYDETECSQQYLSDELRRHALKPDPLDVANFAMFLHQRNEEIALPSPQPADAVREDGRAKAKAKQALYSLRFTGQPMSSMFNAEELGLIVDTVRAALASDPAPAGEAVEPVVRLDGVDEYGPRLGWFKQWTKVPVGTLFYAHPAPEDTARLREDLERAIEREAATAAKADHNADKLAKLEWTVEELKGLGLSWRKRAETAERERDDAREALEEAALWHDAQDKAISKQPNANVGNNGWMRNEHQEQARMLRATARAALATEASR